MLSPSLSFHKPIWIALPWGKSPCLVISEKAQSSWPFLLRSVDWLVSSFGTTLFIPSSFKESYMLWRGLRPRLIIIFLTTFWLFIYWFIYSFILVVPHSMQDLSFPTRDRTPTPSHHPPPPVVAAQCLNHWTARGKADFLFPLPFKKF